MSSTAEHLWGRLANMKARLSPKEIEAPISVSPDRHRPLRWFLVGLVSVSVVSACIENGLHPIVLILLPSAVAGLLRSDYSKPLLWSEKPMTLIFIVYTISFSIGSLLLKGSLTLPGFLVYFTFGTIIIRSVLPLPDRNISQVIFLSIGMVLANSVLTNHLLFAAMLPLYLFFVMGSLLLLQKARAEAHADTRALRPDKTTGLSWYPGLAKYVLFIGLFTAAAFVFLPRPFLSFPGLKAAMARGTGGARLAGQITYRDMLGMAGRNRIAFIAVFYSPLPKEEPYWRGRVLDKTDGSRWVSSEEKRKGGRPISAHSQETIEYHILPHRLQSDTMYIYGFPVVVKGRRHQMLSVNALGETVVDNPFLHTDRYEVFAIKQQPPLNKPLRPIYLDDSKAPEPVKKLALEWTRGARTKKEKVQAIMDRLSRGFTYTLAVQLPPDGVNPIEHFLLTTKTGHCEYYAGALALLLRCVDVPSRVVEGFAGMERTDNKREVIVRFAHAHAWVEALIDDKGWATLDATPPSARAVGGSLFIRFLNDIYDTVDYHWIKMVVNFDRTDQAWLLRAFTNLATGNIDLRRIVSGNGLYVLGGILALLTMSAIPIVIRMRNRRESKGVSEIYTSTMESLRKKGVLTRIHPWHEDNMRDIAVQVPAARESLDEFMSTYMQIRFGGNRIPKERLLEARHELLNKVSLKGDAASGERSDTPAS